MKWAGIHFVEFAVLLGSLLAGLWKVGMLASIGTMWILIGVVIAMSLGIMIVVFDSGSKENMEIQRK